MTERPQIAESRDRYVYRPGTQTVPFFAAPGCSTVPTHHCRRRHPTGGAEGVLLCQGTRVGGWSFYIKDGKLHYAHNYRTCHLHGGVGRPVPAGRHELRFEFEPTDKPDVAHGKGTPGRAQLYIDRHLVGQTDLPVTTPSPPSRCAQLRRQPRLGGDPGLPGAVPFTGTLYSVTVDLSGDLIVDSEAEIRMAMCTPGRTASVARSAKRTPDLGHPVVTCSGPQARCAP